MRCVIGRARACVTQVNLVNAEQETGTGSNYAVLSDFTTNFVSRCYCGTHNLTFMIIIAVQSLISRLIRHHSAVQAVRFVYQVYVYRYRRQYSFVSKKKQKFVRFGRVMKPNLG